jgi:hypothetical protein
MLSLIPLWWKPIFHYISLNVVARVIQAATLQAILSMLFCLKMRFNWIILEFDAHW